MARTKEFDIDDTIDRAVDLFRSKGHAATSVQDLVDHLGINRGSIYDTFDNKDNLYHLALQRYVDQGRRFVDDTLGLDLPLRDRLRRILTALIHSAQGRGCLVVNTACERNDQHPDALAATAAAFDVTRQQLRDAFRTAPEDQRTSHIDPDTSAETILVLMQGLMVMATTGADLTTLDPVITTTLDQLT
jgi:TetR/AcrR family transcriptional repressor of nem operon